MPARKEAREANAKAEQEAEIAAEKDARKKLEEEKRTWVLEFGSDYLRDAIELGYDCQRMYATERSVVEFPGFFLDFDGNADWRERSCPSREALAKVKQLATRGINAKVVWLTVPAEESDPCGDDEEGEFEACEAIVSQEYLGKYDLVKIVG